MAKVAAPKKTETLTLRLDPKTKYAIELLARDQKRTLAGAIEWAVQKAMSSQEVGASLGVCSFQELVDQTWTPDELQRVMNLGANAEHLLSHDESCLWAVIKSNPLFYMDAVKVNGHLQRHVFFVARIMYSEALIRERAEQLAAHGKFAPITLDEIYEASGGDLPAAEKAAEDLTFRISKEKLLKGFGAK